MQRQDLVYDLSRSILIMGKTLCSPIQFIYAGTGAKPEHAQPVFIDFKHVSVIYTVWITWIGKEADKTLPFMIEKI